MFFFSMFMVLSKCQSIKRGSSDLIPLTLHKLMSLLKQIGTTNRLIKKICILPGGASNHTDILVSGRSSPLQ